MTIGRVHTMTNAIDDVCIMNWSDREYEQLSPKQHGETLEWFLKFYGHSVVAIVRVKEVKSIDADTYSKAV